MQVQYNTNNTICLWCFPRGVWKVERHSTGHALIVGGRGVRVEDADELDHLVQPALPLPDAVHLHHALQLKERGADPQPSPGDTTSFTTTNQKPN